MTPERWQRVKELFEAALQREPSERGSFLAEACGGDEELRREVSSLVEADARPDNLLDESLPGVASELLPDESPQVSLSGSTLGHYRVGREVGRGGMGQVYLAVDVRLGRPVALKLLSGSFTSDPDRVARFEQEARAASALNHPNILTIHEVGETDGLRFIVTEYVEGETLRELLARGPLPAGRALDIAAQVASALSAAHAAGVVHRDVKPENVMVRPDGHVKVLDFGLAKVSGSAGAASGTGVGEAATLIKLSTQPGLLMGTVNYMSPEQARGLKVDARTDIWSLGVVIYEMLAGRAPFDGETTSDVLASILTKEPPPLAGCAPEELARVVGRALRKDRAERYASMREMLEELREAREELAFRSHHKGRPGASGGGRRTSEVVREDGPPSSSAGGASGRASRRKAFALLAVALAATLAGASALYLRAGREDSLAVLPFVYTSADAGAANDPEREYISDGLTESIIRDLSQLSDLRVIARSSVFRYKGRESDPRDVGRELNVRTVLTGRIAQRGERLTVSAELVEAESGTRLWGDRYEAGVADLLRVQDEIAEHISSQLRLRLTEGERREKLARHHTPDPEAHRLYLKGRYFWNKRTGADMRRAVDSFRAAVERDPDYALAYAGLSDAWSTLPFYTDVPSAVGSQQAREAARKALEKDERLAEGHAALAWVLAEYDWDRPQAVKALERAIELNPNYATAHHRLGYMLAEAGRFDESIATLRRARDLDPVSLSIASGLGATFYYAGRYDEAVAVYRQASELNPDSVGLYSHLGDAYRQQGLYAEAFEAYRQAAVHSDGGDATLKSRVAVAQAMAGNRAEAERLLEEVLRLAGHREFFAVASVHAALGDKRQALDWLDKSFAARHPEITRLKVDPQFASLRSEPRFNDMIRRLGLEQ